MCEGEGEGKDRQTDPDVFSSAILDGFRDIKENLDDIKERLERLENRQEKVEGKLARVVIDLGTLNKFQKGFVGRLVTVEDHVMDEPLYSEEVNSSPSSPPTPIAVAASFKKKL